MKATVHRSIRCGLACAALAAAFWAGSASAKAGALNVASENVMRALQALRDAPKADKDGSDFDNHRKKAITLLTRAQGELLKAKQHAPKR